MTADARSGPATALTELAVEAFLTRLASADPTPGGGSASALAAAQGAALVAMVARLSEKDGGEAAAATGDRAERLRAALGGLVETDARAFDRVMEAYRLPRGTEAEKARRREAVQAALAEAADVPLAVGEHALEVLRAAADLAPSANRNAISDLGVAALLAAAGAEGALLNVAINVRGLADPDVTARLTAAARRVRDDVHRLRERVLSAVQERLGA